MARGAARHSKTGACSAKAVGGNSSFKKQSLAARLFPYSRLEETGGPSPPPATGPQHSLRSFAPAQATDQKTAPPTVIDRAPWEIIPDKLIVYRLDFLLRRGARGELSLRAGTALRPRRPPLRRAGAPTGRSIGLTGEKPSLSARLGDSFYFARCEIVESLLRRGARGWRELRSGRAGRLLRPRKPQQKPLWGRRAGGASRHAVWAIRKRKTIPAP